MNSTTNRNDISGDEPTKKTNTEEDFVFKLIIPEQLDRIVKRVKKDRLNKQVSAMLKPTHRPELKNLDIDKRIVKTKSSTIKYLNYFPLIDNEYTNINNTSVPIPNNSNIRIMSDAEIQKFIENAVKEVFDEKLMGKSTLKASKNTGSNNNICKSNSEISLRKLAPKHKDELLPSDEKNKSNNVERNTLEDSHFLNLNQQFQRYYDEHVNNDSYLDSARSEKAINCLDYGTEDADKFSNHDDVDNQPNIMNIMDSNSNNTLIEDFNLELIKSENYNIDIMGNFSNYIKSPVLSSKLNASAESLISEVRESITKVIHKNHNYNMSTDDDLECLDVGFDDNEKKQSYNFQSTVISLNENLLERNYGCGENYVYSMSEDSTPRKLNSIKEHSENNMPLKKSPVQSSVPSSNEKELLKVTNELTERNNTNNNNTNENNVIERQIEEKPDPVKKNSATKKTTTKLQQQKKQEKCKKTTPKAAIRKELNQNIKLLSKNYDKPRLEMTMDSPNTLKDLIEMIYSKLTTFQLQIIEKIEKIKKSLTTLMVPKSDEDRKKREINVNEFATRFARNYLYQIYRMIEDIRVLKPEDIADIHTNEPNVDNCIKVCGLYGLLQLSLDIYHKQIKYFICDQQPKKLDLLIECIVNATTICLKHNYFSHGDDVIKEMLQKCEGMKHYLDNLKDINVHHTVAIPRTVNKLRKFSSQNVEEVLNKLNSQINNLDLKNDELSLMNKKSKGNKSKCKKLEYPVSRIQLEDLKITKENSHIQQNYDEAFISNLPLSTTTTTTITTTAITTTIPNKNNSDYYNSNIKEKQQQQQQQHEQEEQQKPSSSKNIPRKTVTTILPKAVKQPAVDEITLQPNELNDVIQIVSSETTNNINPSISDYYNNNSNNNNCKNIPVKARKATKKENKKKINVKNSNSNNSCHDSNIQNFISTTEQEDNNTFGKTKAGQKKLSHKRKTKTNIDYSEATNYRHSSVGNTAKVNATTQTKNITNVINNKSNNNSNATNYGHSSVGNTAKINATTQTKNITNIINNKSNNNVKDNNSMQATVVGNENQQQYQQQQRQEQQQLYYLNDRGDVGGNNLTQHQQQQHVIRNDNANTDYVKQLLFDTNIQYTIIRSYKDQYETLPNLTGNISELNINLISESESCINNKELDPIEEVRDAVTDSQQLLTNSLNKTPKLEKFLSCKSINNSTKNEVIRSEFSNLHSLFENRMEFIKSIAENPLYVNENFSEPWKIVTQISEKLFDELAISVEKEINFGEEIFIEHFLQNEIDF